MLYFESRSAIEKMCKAAGFDIAKSYDVKRAITSLKTARAFVNISGQPHTVTEDRLATFCDRYSKGVSAPFRFLGEVDFHSALITAKPAEPGDNSRITNIR